MACGDYGPIIGVPGTPWVPPWPSWVYANTTSGSGTNDMTGIIKLPAQTFRYFSTPAELAGLRQGMKATDDANDVEFVRATRDRRSKHYRVVGFFALTAEEAVVIGLGLCWIAVHWWAEVLV